MKPLKERITITVDEPVVKKLRELAEESEPSFSGYINLVLKRHVEKLEKK